MASAAVRSRFPGPAGPLGRAPTGSRSDSGDSLSCLSNCADSFTVRDSNSNTTPSHAGIIQATTGGGPGEKSLTRCLGPAALLLSAVRAVNCAAMAMNMFFRQRRSVSNWNVSRMNLLPVHSIIEEKDIVSQHELAMLMLDGFVPLVFCCLT